MFQSGNGTVQFELSSEEALACIFKTIREKLRIKLEYDITNCVLTAPVGFNETQKQTLIDAANIAGYTVKAVLAEPVACCFWYVYHKQDMLKDKFIEDYPEEFYILSLDFGDSSFNAALVKYNDEGYEVKLTHGSDNHSGIKLIDKFINAFVEKNGTINLDDYDFIDKNLFRRDFWKKYHQLDDSTSSLDISISCKRRGDLAKSTIPFSLSKGEVEEILSNFTKEALDTVAEKLKNEGNLQEGCTICVYQSGSLSSHAKVNEVIEKIGSKWSTNPSLICNNGNISKLVIRFEREEDQNCFSSCNGALLYGERSMLNKQRSMQQKLDPCTSVPADFVMRDLQGNQLTLLKKGEPIPAQGLRVEKHISVHPHSAKDYYQSHFYAVYDKCHEIKFSKPILINNLFTSDDTRVSGRYHAINDLVSEMNSTPQNSTSISPAVTLPPTPAIPPPRPSRPPIPVPPPPRKPLPRAGSNSSLPSDPSSRPPLPQHASSTVSLVSIPKVSAPNTTTLPPPPPSPIHPPGLPPRDQLPQRQINTSGSAIELHVTVTIDQYLEVICEVEKDFMYKDGARDQFPICTKNKEEIEDMKRKYEMKMCSIRVQLMKTVFASKFRSAIRRNVAGIAEMENEYNALCNQPASQEVVNALENLSKRLDKASVRPMSKPNSKK